MDCEKERATKDWRRWIGDLLHMGGKRASALVVFDQGDGAYGKAGVAVGGVRRRRCGLGFWVLDLREGLGHDGPELKQ